MRENVTAPRNYSAASRYSETLFTITLRLNAVDGPRKLYFSVVNYMRVWRFSMWASIFSRGLLSSICHSSTCALLEGNEAVQMGDRIHLGFEGGVRRNITFE